MNNQTSNQTFFETFEPYLPSDMERGEFTTWIIVAAVVMIGLCVLCCIFKQILMFCVIIAVFAAAVFWYLYMYRNKPN